MKRLQLDFPQISQYTVLNKNLPIINALTNTCMRVR